MTIADEIFAWATSRPPWQLAVLTALAAGQVVDDTATAQIADALLDGTPTAMALAPAAVAVPPAAGGTVTVLGIREAHAVNALAEGQQLTFGPTGLTVVYGDNGSGKSGYARLLKSAVRARHTEDVLPDVFDTQVGVPSAVVRFAVNGLEHDHSWPSGSADELRQVAFYDESCGDNYVTRDLELTYRPADLILLDGLIAVLDKVRSHLDSRIAKNMARAQPLPALPPETAAGVFLAGMSGRTSTEALDNACTLPDDVEGALVALDAEHLRLRESDPALERTRHAEAAATRDVVAAHLRRLNQRLGAEPTAELETLAEQALQLRAAAAVASAADFADQPVAGVGTETWRALWESARAYSQTAAYPNREFPASNQGDACVLCQQDLTQEAQGRLARFDTFMRDDTQSRALRAEQKARQALEHARDTPVQPLDVGLALRSLTTTGVREAPAAQAEIDAFAARLVAIEDWEPSTGPLRLGPSPAGSTADSLSAGAHAERTAADAVDASGFGVKITEVVRARSELQARAALAAARDSLAVEIRRRAERLRLEAAKGATDTTGVTRKSTELAREHVTDVVRDRFTRELDRLRLDRVTLRDTGGKKGQLLHKPSFLGAARDVALDTVLSEGEQTALGLAGFFTEAHFDATRSSLVFDDPISSLDHFRRSKVAERLADLGTSRQVIVFTHDVTFAGELRKHSEAVDVAYTARSVERAGNRQPGMCKDGHPWNAKDAKQRLAPSLQ
jgi:energy-coupling factor transporter ATP-binding protein EcfA2